MLGGWVTNPSVGLKPLLKALSEGRKHTNCSNGQRTRVKVQSFSSPLWPGGSLNSVANKGNVMRHSRIAALQCVSGGNCTFLTPIFCHGGRCVSTDALSKCQKIKKAEISKNTPSSALLYTQSFITTVEHWAVKLTLPSHPEERAS